MHQSVSKIPPEKIVKYSRIIKQSPISNLFLGKLMKKYGLIQIGTYLKTRKRSPVITYPYMPEGISSKGSYLYDFHTHSKFSDGKGSYKEILMEISQKKHLNGIAITDHPFKPCSNKFVRYVDNNTIKRSFKINSLVQDLKKKGKLPESFISFPGSCEFLTNLGENDPSAIEIIALGVPENFIELNRGVKYITHEISALELIERIHDENGIAIIPHPFFMVKSFELLKIHNLSRNSRPDAFEGLNYSTGFLSDRSYFEFFERFPYYTQFEALSHIFGYFNWMSTIISQKNDYGKHFNYPLAQKIACVGSSDAHILCHIGATCTLTKEPIDSIEGLRRVFLKKETIPIHNPLWSQKTEKNRVYDELWKGYGEMITKGISSIRKKPLFKLVLMKKIIDIFSYFLT